MLKQPLLTGALLIITDLQYNMPPDMLIYSHNILFITYASIYTTKSGLNHFMRAVSMAAFCVTPHITEEKVIWWLSLHAWVEWAKKSVVHVIWFYFTSANTR